MKKLLLLILPLAFLLTPFVASADYQCWSSTTGSSASPSFTTIQPSNTNTNVNAGSLCQSAGGSAVYNTATNTWINLDGSSLAASPFATSYDCPAGETWSSTGASGHGSCVALPTGYSYNNISCREPSGNVVSVQNKNQCDSLNGTLTNDSTNACNGQWIADGAGWKCQPPTITSASQLSDTCLNKPSVGCTAAENAFLNNQQAIQNQGATCPAGQTWSVTAGCVTPQAPATPTAPAVTPPTTPTSRLLTYVPLEPLPGDKGNNAVYNDATKYLALMFNILLSIGAMIAVVTLVLGGITYMVSEIADKKSEARKRMQGAVLGLLLLLTSWLILHEVNPNLLNFSLLIPGSSTTGPNGLAGAPSAPPSAAQINAATQGCNGVVQPAPGTNTLTCYPNI